MKVLVGYATAHGSTQGIAERIAERLGAQALEVDCRALSKDSPVAQYDAFVLGSAIHNQAWLPEAEAFIADNHGTLGLHPLWVFSVGMPAALPGPLSKLAMREADKVMARFGGSIQPRDHRLFSGAVEESQLPGTGKWIFRLFGASFGDFRDWPQIEAWGDAIASTLVSSLTDGP